jgi:RecA/RadA recombinase
VSKLKKDFEPHTLFDKPRILVSTGVLALDYIISGKYDGTGGIPLGWIVELAGKSQTGKSLLGYKLAVEFQRRGGYVFVNDSEYAYQPEKAEQLGMNHTHVSDGGRFHYDDTECIEEFFNKAQKFCEDVRNENTNDPIAILLDSLGVMMTADELEAGMKYEDMGRRAKRLKECARQILPVLNKYGATLIVANHVYDTLAMMGPKQVSGGGMALDYTTNLRIFFQSTKHYPNEKDKEGVILRAKIVKNRMNFEAEGKVCEFAVDWEQGPLKYTGLLPMLVTEIKDLSQAGGWYDYRGHKFRANDFAGNPEQYFEMFHDGEKDEEASLGVRITKEENKSEQYTEDS